MITEQQINEFLQLTLKTAETLTKHKEKELATQVLRMGSEIAYMNLQLMKKYKTPWEKHNDHLFMREQQSLIQDEV